MLVIFLCFKHMNLFCKKNFFKFFDKFFYELSILYIEEIFK